MRLFNFLRGKKDKENTEGTFQSADTTRPVVYYIIIVVLHSLSVRSGMICICMTTGDAEDFEELKSFFVLFFVFIILRYGLGYKNQSYRFEEDDDEDASSEVTLQPPPNPYHVETEPRRHRVIL